MQNYPKNTLEQAKRIEQLNSRSHAVGVGLGIIFLASLLIPSIHQSAHLKIISFTIYGLCFIFMFLMSAVYHGIRKPSAKAIMRVFDHISIYFFIAGTYTPIILLVLNGPLRTFFIILVWILAFSGAFYKLLSHGNYDNAKRLSVALYIGMGWIALFMIRPLIEVASLHFFVWLTIGGILYTSGTYFYKAGHLIYHHVIWHFFVLGGAIAHFIAIYLFLA